MRLSLISMLMLSALVVDRSVLAQDRLVIAPPDTSGEIIIRGEIVDFVGSTIRIRPDGTNDPQVVPVSQIVRIETYYSPDYRTGLELMQAGGTQEAEETLIRAYESEPRGWVRREILAALVQCAERREDHITAANRFMEIIRDDPQSRFWGIAPVPWIPVSPSDALREEARAWLGRGFEVDRFLGACWLLFDATYHEAAITVLRDLSRATNTRMSTMASAQQWRLRLRDGDMSANELAGWRNHIESMSIEFRSGPQALLAMGYYRQGQYEQSAAEWLWISTVYTEQDVLTAKATFEGAECLNRLGRTDEAIRLFTETAERFPWSSQASVARQRLDELQSRTTQ